MSRENVEIVERLVAALGAGDYRRAAEFLDPGVEWHNTASFPGPTSMIGAGPVEEFWRDLFGTYSASSSDSGMEVERRAGAGDIIVVSVHGWGRGRGSGVPVDLRWAHTMRLNAASKVERVDTYGTFANALEAAGQSQQNERTILALVAAFNRGDWDTALSYAAPDFKYDTTRDLNETRGLYQTPEEVKRALERFYEPWEFWHNEVTEFTHVDETLVVTRQTGHLRGRDGIEVMARTSAVWRFRDGLVSEFVHYREEDDARETVGLSG